MKEEVIWFVIVYLYKYVLRDLLLKAIEDPEQEWDDFILKLCDGLFDYDPNPTLESGINHG